MLVVLGLVVALIIAGNERAKTDTQNRELREQNEQLRDKNEKLKTEGLNETRKVEPVSQTPVSLGTTPRVISVSGGCEQYRGLVSQYPWNVEIVLKIMFAESGCDPNAISKTFDYGLLQLHNIKIFDPAQNIAYAYNEKYLKGGFSHWSVCNNSTVKCW